MLAKYLAYADFVPIRNNELEILQKLTPLEIYKTDASGDLIVISEQPLKFAVDKYNPNIDIILSDDMKVNGTVENDVINNFEDVFGLDEYLHEKSSSSKSPVNNLQLLTFWKNNEYQGCVWTFENDEFFGIYGIRSSLKNYLLSIKGIASLMMEDIIKRAHGRKIIVPWPLPSMVPVLRKFKFKEYNVEEMNREKEFLEPITSTSNYWIYYPIIIFIKGKLYYYDHIENEKIVCVNNQQFSIDEQFYLFRKF